MTPQTERDDEAGRAADVAHDVLNAVATIRARAQMTRRRVGRIDDLSRDHIGADLAQIEAQAQRLIGLIDRLCRIDGGGDGPTGDRSPPTPVPEAVAASPPPPRPGLPPTGPVNTRGGHASGVASPRVPEGGVDSPR